MVDGQLRCIPQRVARAGEPFDSDPFTQPDVIVHRAIAPRRAEYRVFAFRDVQRLKAESVHEVDAGHAWVIKIAIFAFLRQS